MRGLSAAGQASSVFTKKTLASEGITVRRAAEPARLGERRLLAEQ
jgi:hypothetical protein